jgi:hypothetical protein
MKILLIVAILSSSSAAMGAEQIITCPERYPSGDYVQLADVPKGWDGEGRVTGSLPLIGAGFYAGPEVGGVRGEMMGVGKKTKDGWETRFPMDAQMKEKWIACTYGQGGSVELLHRVAPAAQTLCVVITKKRKFPNKPIVTATCK